MSGNPILVASFSPTMQKTLFFDRWRRDAVNRVRETLFTPTGDAARDFHDRYGTAFVLTNRSHDTLVVDGTGAKQILCDPVIKPINPVGCGDGGCCARVDQRFSAR